MINLKKEVDNINELLQEKREKLKLTFTEEGHIYTMLDLYNVLRDDFPSVSTVEKNYYDEFDAAQKALDKSFGNVEGQQELLAEWAAAGKYATDMGSRAHYELEKYILRKNKIKKETREPIYECCEQQIIDSDNMIKAGQKFLDLMESRGCVLLDTEVVLGSPELGFVGQADNFWLCLNKDKTGFGFIITDHKTNKPKNLVPMPYNDNMLSPFNKWISFALTHYYVQLGLYARLFKEMLKGTKYEDIPLLGCILDSLRSDGTFEEYRVPKEFTDYFLTTKKILT